jgi:glutamate---cysteine ligase / carboxylate-amine ligase
MTSQRLHELLAHSRPPSFGVEEEVMLLDPETLDLAPSAAELLADATAGEENCLKLELPASQVELVSPPRDTIAELAGDLAGGRRRLIELAGGRVRLAAAGAHPFTATEGALNSGDRYARIEDEYGPVARRQLVCGLHVHVGLSGAERVLAVYNALRAHLPELAALGANAPLARGRDAGVASVRPLISGLLPRQGIPPAYASLDALAEDLSWGARAGRLEGSSGWWWELRVHPSLGTVEVRVPDAQTTATEAAALAAVAAGLVLRLAALHDAGELPPVSRSWRIAENRWSATRHGVHGEMLDMQTGARTPTAERLHALIDAVRPFAAEAGGAAQIDQARELVERNGADRQREIALARGPQAVARWLDERFSPDPRRSAR